MSKIDFVDIKSRCNCLHLGCCIDKENTEHICDDNHCPALVIASVKGINIRVGQSIVFKNGEGQSEALVICKSGNKIKIFYSGQFIFIKPSEII